MKTILLFIVSFCTCTLVAWGQNSVSVKQQGNRNSVSINQSSASSDTPAQDCPEQPTNRKGNTNKILVLKSNISDDTLFTKSGTPVNIYLGIKNLLSVQQNGAGNFTFLAVPSDSTNSISTRQKGVNNITSAQLKDPNTLNISQSGSTNWVNINDCIDGQDERK